MIGSLLLLVIAAILILFHSAGARPGPAALLPAEAPASVFPVKSPAGWGRGEVERYDIETLFEKINGKADAYLPYEFASLEFASYARPDDPAVFVDVYLYDMTRSLNAYGIYRTQRSGNEERLEITEEGCAAGASAFARKGRFYLEVMASGDEAAGEARSLAAAVAAALPESEAPVTDPAWFPAAGLKSVRYVRENCLMVEALKDAFLAVYEDGTKVVVATGGEAEGKEAQETLGFLGTAFEFRVAGTRLVGVVGRKDAKLLEEVVRRLEAAR
jgi:hypothetical protein